MSLYACFGCGLTARSSLFSPGDGQTLHRAEVFGGKFDGVTHSTPAARTMFSPAHPLLVSSMSATSASRGRMDVSQITLQDTQAALGAPEDAEDTVIPDPVGA